MRKILLGTTAVAGFALAAPQFAAAQQAPTVRIGGFITALYGYTQQTGTAPTNISMNTIGGSDAAGANGGVSVPAVAPPALPPGYIGGNVPASARLGNNDFMVDAEVHVFVNGKAANGLAYGAVLEIAFNQQEGAVRNDARRAVDGKTTASMDEMYAVLATPTLGQIRFGDEDGPLGGLMNAGFVTNFGTGGVYGQWESFTVRPNRTTTSPGGLGDNTKVIYLSPQFFGFDFGASWAFNEGDGEDTGCLNSFASINCDRAYAITGSQGTARSHNLPGRLNELQAVLRWRGNLAGVGLAASLGTMQSSVIRNIDTAGNIVKNLRSPQVYQAGLQASYLGVTLGANYMWGNTTFFYIPTARGDKDMEQYFVGGSYTIGPVTVGANAFWGTYAGATGLAPGFGGNPNALPPLGRGQRRWAYSIGANYRLAPGLDVIAEFTHHEIKLPGVSQNIPAGNLIDTNAAVAGVQNPSDVRDRARTSVFMTGVRLAF
ncbi:MAG: porin [Acetobacteraceae bacterium]|nr:porin [Acetobacteraceae bacterium]